MENIREQLGKIVEKIFDVKASVNVTVAPENTGADYATNVAMQLAKLVHKNPMVIAEMIKAELEKTKADYKIVIMAPGFINFQLDEAAIIGKARDLAKAEEINFLVKKEYQDKTVVAEFSDPNPFKILHVGHLYTSIVGDSISRLLEFAGANVVRANFGGDVGLHVAKTLYVLDLLSERSTSSNPAVLSHRTSKYGSFRASDSSRISSQIIKPLELDEKDSNSSRTSSKIASSRETGEEKKSSNELEDVNEVHEEEKGYDSFDRSTELLKDLTIEDIARSYVQGTRAYEEDEAAKAEITKLNKEIYRINAEDLHDSKLAQLYWRGRELSYEYFRDFYERIGVRFDKYYPESLVAGRGLEEVRAHTGTTYEESDGAVVYKGEKVGLHTRVFINREGVPTYEAKDVGLIFTKWDDWHFDESVVVTGNEQSDYMKVVLASVSEYAPKLTERTTHLTHGLVKLPGNVKMSSRKGNFLKAVEVLRLINDLFSERGQDTVDERLVLAAIKYAFLKYKMGGDIVFDPQESISTTGNSGIYLLYSAVRAKKILGKCGQEKITDVIDAELEKNFEKQLSKKMIQYSDVLKEAIDEKAPYKICNYLYELSQEFSRFYEHVRVVGNPREDELKLLVQAYYNIMENGLGLLGIEIPENM